MTRQPWRVHVSTACIGSGLCLATAPGRFRLVDGRSEPVDAHVEVDDDIAAAADLCPAEAITVRES